ncbi:hypothetical protein B0H63DRAFT_459664 [Podospora didyma]|uniref:RRM domain-containing protein n=1 Tax=Podospora didyma TaxID=330526 RepID=A0AAE0P656_9PEZI|nr:hypothetical protein B0H63DRAFT_459664 [Podospora didyma]
MNSIRRSAVSSALAASRTVATKASTTSLAAQLSRKTNIAKPVFAQAARLFSKSARALNESRSQEEGFESLEQKLESPGTGLEKRENKQTPYGVFVRNLIFDATEEHLNTSFEKFGQVAWVNVARDPRGLSKGYGFVYFTNADDQAAACEGLNGTFWHGRRITVMPRSGGRDGDRAQARQRTSEPSAQLYIGNIPYETTDVELNRLFKGLDNLKDVRVAVDRTTGWPRGFAHADFADVESAQAAYERLANMKIGDRTLSIDYAAGYIRGGNDRRKKPEARTRSHEDNSSNEQ